MNGRTDGAVWLAVTVVVATAMLASCRGQPPAMAMPERAVAAIDSGSSSIVPSTPLVAPPPELGGAADAGQARAEAAGCQTNAECGRGQVCGRCGEAPGKCIPGCSTSADCPAGSTCVQVQCIRCPCPGECMKR